MSKCKSCNTPNRNDRKTCVKCGSDELIHKEPKVFNPTAVYEKTLKYYLFTAKPPKSVEEANMIAQKVVEEQKAIWTKRNSTATQSSL